MSTKYPRAVFLKVDVDKCQETAAAQGVSAMPTFIFYRNRVSLCLMKSLEDFKIIHPCNFRLKSTDSKGLTL